MHPSYSERQKILSKKILKPIITHSWDLNRKEAVEIQEQLAAKVVKKDRLSPVKVIAGVDVAYAKSSDRLIAAVVTLDAHTLAVT